MIDEPQESSARNSVAECSFSPNEGSRWRWNSESGTISRPITERLVPPKPSIIDPETPASSEGIPYDCNEEEIVLANNAWVLMKLIGRGNMIKSDIPCLELFISSRGNEYFCEIDEDYLTDRFNLTGINADVQYYQHALDLVTDVFDLDCDDDMREEIEKSARHLYGLVHARYITTTRGLAKMLEKYKKSDFGKCPRVMCSAHPLLPTGLADLPHVQSVKLYCAKCEDLYNPKSTRHATIDGAYFGTSFQNILFQVYPALIPEKTVKRYVPRVFGFKVHAAAALQRWQDIQRDEMQKRLKVVGLENCFIEDVTGSEEEMEEDDEVEDVDGLGMDIGEE